MIVVDLAIASTVMIALTSFAGMTDTAILSPLDSDKEMSCIRFSLNRDIGFLLETKPDGTGDLEGLVSSWCSSVRTCENEISLLLFDREACNRCYCETNMLPWYRFLAVWHLRDALDAEPILTRFFHETDICDLPQNDSLQMSNIVHRCVEEGFVDGNCGFHLPDIPLESQHAVIRFEPAIGHPATSIEVVKIYVATNRFLWKLWNVNDGSEKESEQWIARFRAIPCPNPFFQQGSVDFSTQFRSLNLFGRLSAAPFSETQPLSGADFVLPPVTAALKGLRFGCDELIRNLLTGRFGGQLSKLGVKTTVDYDKSGSAVLSIFKEPWSGRRFIPNSVRLLFGSELDGVLQNDNDQLATLAERLSASIPSDYRHRVRIERVQDDTAVVFIDYFGNGIDDLQDAFHFKRRHISSSTFVWYPQFAELANLPWYSSVTASDSKAEQNTAPPLQPFNPSTLPETATAISADPTASPLLHRTAEAVARRHAADAD